MLKYSTENGYTRDELEEMKAKSGLLCSECGEPMEIFRKSISENEYFLACSDWRRTHHEADVERPASRYEKEGMESFNLEKRREIVTEEHGKTKTRALAKYINTGAITKPVATEIVETLWGRAPKIEKTKAILLCHTYQLNPLMKHLYLIPYKRKDKKGNEIKDANGNYILDWSIQIGIGATRLMAQRKHNYSYMDMSPRKATKVEIDKILGDTYDPNQIYGFCHIKDVETGAEAYGIRGIKKNANIKGADKGNTHLNLACIRAERQSLDRQYPGEMPPSSIEVVDETYMEAPGVGKIDIETGEIIEGEATEVPDNDKPEELATIEPTHWCDEHGCAFEQKSSRFGVFYSHKVEGGYCKEKKEKGKVTAAAPDESQATPESEEAGEMWSDLESDRTPESALAEQEALEAEHGKITEAESIESDKVANQELATVGNIGHIDSDWLRESLKKIQDKKLKAWTDANLLSYMKVTYKVEDKTLLGSIAKLDKNKAAHFVKNIQETLSML